MSTRSTTSLLRDLTVQATATIERLSGQRLYPVIEFTKGRVYRAESKDMATRIRAGQLLDEARTAGPVAPA